MISWNKLLVAKEKGEMLQDKHAADENGKPTEDPELAKALLPIGGYKGYGIAAMGEVLCGVLTGMGFGRSILPCSPRLWKNLVILASFTWLCELMYVSHKHILSLDCSK